MVRCFALLFFLCLMLCACATDQRKELAFHTLFSRDGRPDMVAIGGALAAKFPPGTPVETLKSYVELNGGSCEETQRSHVWCEIVLQTTFCAASILGVNVEASGGSIKVLDIKLGGLGC